MRQATAPCSYATFGLMPRQPAAVARQHDLALHVDAELLQPVVVRRHAVVDVDDFAGGVAVGGVGVEDRRGVGVVRVRILGQDRFLDRHGGSGRRHHLDDPLGRPGHHRLEALDPRIEAPRLELVQRVLGDLPRTPAGRQRAARRPSPSCTPSAARCLAPCGTAPRAGARRRPRRSGIREWRSSAPPGADWRVRRGQGR